MQEIQVKDFKIGSKQPLTFISGPCVIESLEHAKLCAKRLKEITSQFPIQFIFKASYDKANRSSIDSFRGPGIEKGLEILREIKEEFNLPIITDIHTPEQAQKVSEVVDLIQIPAFLCRQTDLVVAAGKTKKPIQVKKGQFMAPWDMKSVVEKIESTGNKQIILVDRGTSFGYNNLVSDMRAIPIMQELGYPVCYDATHSIQLPGGLGHVSGGKSEFAPLLAKAAIAAGANCLFMESHPNPKEAKSDAACVVDLKILPSLLDELVKIYNIVNA